MKCSQVTSFFDRMYRDGDSFNRPDVSAHVATCEECSRRYRQWQQIASRLSTAAPLVPSSALYGKVMRAISQSDEGKAVFRFPLSLSFPTVAISFTMVLLVVAAVLFINAPQIEDRTVQITHAVSFQTHPEPLVAHFEITLPGVQQVALVGDFNRWDTEHTFLNRRTADKWSIDVPLHKGSYQYLFYVDGKLWRSDPESPDRIPDGFGGYNSVIEL